MQDFVNSQKKINICCFGECLIDSFPDRSLVGGAILNVSSRLRSLGAEVVFISSVGRDEEGESIRKFMDSRQLSTAYLQDHPTLPTGKTVVTLDESKSAKYELIQPVAWDEILYQEKIVSKIKQSDAFVFGSLSLRSPVNEKTLTQMLSLARFKICDLNLRQPFYNKKIIDFCLENTDLLKINTEEMKEMALLYEIKHSNLFDQIDDFSTKTGIKQICVSQGEQGAVFYHHGKIESVKGIPAKVIDTVGAGDSFLATFIFQLISGKSISYALNYGCAVGALTTEHSGANPSISLEEIKLKLSTVQKIEEIEKFKDSNFFGQ